MGVREASGNGIGFKVEMRFRPYILVLTVFLINSISQANWYLFALRAASTKPENLKTKPTN